MKGWDERERQERLKHGKPADGPSGAARRDADAKLDAAIARTDRRLAAMHEQELKRATHKHKEAFCLMVYECSGKQEYSRELKGMVQTRPPCGHRETFWNSRDGVTPFGMSCPSCGGNLYHIHWDDDVYAPNHKPHFGQGVWRDGTPDDAEAIMRKRIAYMVQDAHSKGDSATVARYTEEYVAKLVDDARNNQMPGSFQQGWPMFYRHEGW